ncbi:MULTISPECIES: hypothetical protein [unclassified Spiroplasma]
MSFKLYVILKINLLFFYCDETLTIHVGVKPTISITTPLPLS